MQTFLPYSDIKKSLNSLDLKRLGKQRLEAYQIIRVYLGETGGYKNHPTTKMWEGYLPLLITYYNLSLQIWKKAGCNNTMLPVTLNSYCPIDYPWWWGEEDFHKSHRARLLVKDENFYSQHFSLEEKTFNEGRILYPLNETKTFIYYDNKKIYRF